MGLQEDMNKAAQEGSVSRLEQLAARGADVNALQDGYTPLVWAAARNHPAAVRWLLDHGAKPDLRSPDNRWTPLMSAAKGNYGEVARMLIEAGADPMLESKDGQSALRFARDGMNKGLIALFTETPDEVVFTDKVYDRVVQEVYSFKRKERFTFIRKEEFGDIEAVQRDSFSDLRDLPQLRAAFEIHRKRGGKTTEEEIFDNSLPKAKLRQPGATP